MPPSAFSPGYRWILPPDLPSSIVHRYPRASRPLLQVMHTRCIVAPDDSRPAPLRSFLSVDIPDPDPFLFVDMDRAVDRILHEIRQRRPIGVFGHYDCDGVTSTVLLSQALAALGATVIPHIPSRSDDYGIPLNGIRRLADAGVRLIVTVDCGIKASAEVAAAAAMGIDVIITDHHTTDRQAPHCPHSPGDSVPESYLDRLPAAIAVINPKRADCPYPFKSLAGVGVAYRLAHALAIAAPDSPLTDDALVNLLDLVALGTIADVVDLVGENRGLVARGLEVLRKSRRPGIRSLAGVARIAPDQITAKDVAFMLAPRINAASRLKHGVLGHDLLCAPDCLTAAPLAEELEQLNRERRHLTQQAVDHACSLLETRLENDPVLVAAGDWLTGISGLVASQLKERFGRPALAIAAGAPFDGATLYPASPESEGPAKAVPSDSCVGSARSIPGYDITGALQDVQHHLVRFGGHPGAAGFTVIRDRIPALTTELNSRAKTQIEPDQLGPRLIIDAFITTSDLTPAFYSQLERFEPCGQGNPPPVFLLTGAAPLPGSIRTYENGRFSCKISGPAGPIKVGGPIDGLDRHLDRGQVLDIVCQVHPDDSRPRLRLSLLDGRSAIEPAAQAPPEIVHIGAGIE